MRFPGPAPCAGLDTLRHRGLVTPVNTTGSADRLPEACLADSCALTEILFGNNVDRVSAHYAVQNQDDRVFAHYDHTERNHQGLDGRLIASPASVSGAGPIDCRERLGGLLRFYHRQAA